MRPYGASISDVIDDVTWLYDVILVKSQSSKTSHSETRTRIDYQYEQTLLTWLLLLVYTRDTQKVQW